MIAGEIVRVVLDVNPLDDGTYQVLVQGVFAEAGPLPPRLPGMDRNVVSCFAGANMRGVSAFRIIPDGPADV